MKCIFVVAKLDRFVYDLAYYLNFDKLKIDHISVDIPVRCEVQMNCSVAVIQDQLRFMNQEVKEADSFFLKMINNQEGLETVLMNEYELYTNTITKKIQDAGFKDKTGNPPSQTTITDWIQCLLREKNRVANIKIIPEKVEIVPEPKVQKDSIDDKVILNGVEFSMDEIRKMIAEKQDKEKISLSS